MPDALRVIPPGMRFLNASAAVLAGGSLEFYQAGTSTPRTVYSDSGLSSALGTICYLDSGGYPVTTQGGSTKTNIYTGINAYKIIAKNSSAGTEWTHDNIIGALDTSGFTATTALPKTPTVTKSSDYTVVDGDRGKVINCNPSGGTFTITLPNATTVGDNWLVIIKNRVQLPSSNVVKILPVASQTIAGPIGDAAVTSFVLTSRGEGVWLVSNGSNWDITSYIPPLMRPNGLGAIVIKDRISSAPSSDPGARYIATGNFLTFETGDIIEDDGQGSWFEYTPATDCGWIAYVQDEDIYYYFRGSAWVAETATSTQQGTVKVSTQAIMETATATDTAVLVGHTHYHPGVAKAVVHFGVTANILFDYGVASITDVGAGEATITVDTAFASTDAMVALCCLDQAGSGTEVKGLKVTPATTTTVTILCEDSSGNNEDATSYAASIFGDVP